MSNIAGRSEMLAAIFFLLTLLAYQKAMKERTFTFAWLFAALCFSALSLLCKEQGITVLGLCLVYEAISSFNAVHRMKNECGQMKR